MGLTASVPRMKYVIASIFLGVLLLCAYPVVFYAFPIIRNIPFQIVQLGSSGVLFLLCLFTKLKYQKNVMIYALALSLICTIYLPLHADMAYLSQVIVIVMAVTAYLIVYNIIGLKKFAVFFIKFILVLSILGTIAFFLVFLGILHPIIEYTNLDTRPGWFFGITCTNSYIGNFIRYSGIFDEPGYMAYWGIFALILNRVILKSKKIEIWLMICLSFTFSLAFFIQAFILTAVIWIKSVKRILMAFLIIGCSYFVINSFQNNENLFWIWQVTLGRLEVSDSGDFNGNNRSELTDLTKPYFIQHPIFGIGGTQMANIEKQRGIFLGANPFTLLARDGIVGYAVMYSFLIALLFYSRRDKEILIYVLVLFLGFLQRPCDLKLLTYFMYLIMFAVMTYKYRNNDKNYNYNI